MSVQEKAADIGILYNRKKHARMLDDMIGCLRKASKRSDLSILLFSLDSVDVENARARGIWIAGGSIAKATVPLPCVVCNTALHSKPRSIAVMRRLRQSPGHRFINPINRFSQRAMLDIISTLPEAERCLLPYQLFDEETFIEEVQRDGAVVLLPERGLYRRTAILINDIANSDGTQHYRIRVGATQQYERLEQLAHCLKLILPHKQRHVLFRWPDLLGGQEDPIEARVYLQKDGSAHWQLTAMAAKKEIFLPRRAKEKPDVAHLHAALQEIVPEQAQSICQQIEELSPRIATHLDHFIQHLGSLTLDYVIGTDGRQYLLFVGGHEQNDYLFRLGDRRPWKNSIASMIGYASHLHAIMSREGGANRDVD